MPYVILQPELEMVARGLEKLLKFEQREILMNMLTGVCSEESHRSAAEALGLLHVCLSSLPEIVIVFHLMFDFKDLYLILYVEKLVKRVHVIVT